MLTCLALRPIQCVGRQLRCRAARFARGMGPDKVWQVLTQAARAASKQLNKSLCGRAREGPWSGQRAAYKISVHCVASRQSAWSRAARTLISEPFLVSRCEPFQKKFKNLFLKFGGRAAQPLRGCAARHASRGGRPGAPEGCRFAAAGPNNVRQAIS